METEMNTPQPHVFYLLNSLITSKLWHISSHDSLTLHVNINHIKCEDKFLMKSTKM